MYEKAQFRARGRKKTALPPTHLCHAPKTLNACAYQTLFASPWTPTQGCRPGQSNEVLSHQLLDQYIGAGGNFIDTADIYQHGLSERIIGQYFVKRPELRSKMIIATKVTVCLRESMKCGCLQKYEHIIVGTVFCLLWAYVVKVVLFLYRI